MKSGPEVYNVGHACLTGACGKEGCECESFDLMKTNNPFAIDMPHPPAHEGCDCFMTEPTAAGDAQRAERRRRKAR